MTMADHDYGYSHALRRFDGILSIRENALQFRKRIIPWQDVVGYRGYPKFWGDELFMFVKSPQPRLSIYFVDGSLLKVRGDLLRKKDRVAATVDGMPSAYMQLIEELERRGVPEWHGPTEESALFRAAAFLGWTAAIVAFSISSRSGIDYVQRMAVALVIGVAAANLSFFVSPYIAKRARLKYMSQLIRNRERKG